MERPEDFDRRQLHDVPAGPDFCLGAREGGELFEASRGSGTGGHAREHRSGSTRRGRRVSTGSRLREHHPVPGRERRAAGLGSPGTRDYLGEYSDAGRQGAASERRKITGRFYFVERGTGEALGLPADTGAQRCRTKAGAIISRLQALRGPSRGIQKPRRSRKTLLADPPNAVILPLVSTLFPSHG